MHRIRIWLEEWQQERLRVQAKRQGRSLAVLIREILTEHLQRVARSRLERIEGVAEGPPDLGRHHDRYLYGDLPG
jgi:plasmid stability protein